MNDIESPFSLYRFEYERNNLYYLPCKIFNELENVIPTYIYGSRGTGKTTLLQALNWEERLKNKSLQHALKGKLFRKNYIGVYLKMPLFGTKSFDVWLKDKPEDFAGPFFGLYIDLIWIEELTRAIAELIVSKHINAPPEEEYGLTKLIIDAFPEIPDFKIEEPYTLLQFKRTIYTIRRKFENYAKKRINPDEILEYYPLGQVGEFGRKVGNIFAGFCQKYFKQKGNQNFHFKICFDEAECLSYFQQKVMNTFFRLSASDVIFIVSYIRKIENVSETTILSLTLQKADRQLINLDDLDNNEFKILSEGVATVRVQNRLNNYDINFRNSRILGKLNINLLLKYVIDKSESKLSKSILESAKAFAQTSFYKDNQQNTIDEDLHNEKYMPIYQKYIIDKLEIKIPNKKDPRWKRRSQESREIRKRMVAAYLCICGELKQEVRYAFDQMVLQMSDKCIRDYLSQMNEVFLEVNRPLDDFIKCKNISIAKQHNALKRASIKKKDSIPNSGITAPRKTGRLIDGLAQITEKIQKSGLNNSALRSSERGIFVVDSSQEFNLDLNEHLSLLKEANEAGFLSQLECEGSKWRFRVHSSLAAAYGFSYRGAYYEVVLNPNDLDRIVNTEDPDEYKKFIEKIGNNLSGETKEYQKQMSLPM